MTSQVADSLFSFLGSFTSSKLAPSVVIFTHRQADPDALCSAYALSQYFISRQRAVEGSVPFQPKIIVPQASGTLGENVSSSLGIIFQNEIDHEKISSADLIAAVDVGDTNLLEPFVATITKSKATKILIDHHSAKRDSSNGGVETSPIFDHVFVDSKATSTCEIFTRGFPETELDGKLSSVLLVGLLFDSQHLGIATQSTLEAALKLVKSGARIDESKEILRQRPEKSEIIAKLKAAKRLDYSEVGSFLIVQTEVSSFQAAVARMLVEIGADVGIAYGTQDGEARLSVRTTQKFFRETLIDMGSLFGRIAAESSIAGGGHATAASMSGKQKIASELAQRIFSELKSRLSLPQT